MILRQNWLRAGARGGAGAPAPSPWRPGLADRGPLQRLDRHLAELHHALAVLQRERALLEHAVAHGDGLLTVERHGDMAALGSDLECVPLAPGLRHWVHLGEIDDRAGAVGRVFALIVDVDLVAGLGADALRIGAANEDAAVG